MSNEPLVAEHGAVARGAGRWSNEDPTPKFGWSLEYVSDLGKGNYKTCEMCQTAHVRFVHQMRHPSGLQLAVGCICSAYMNLTVFHDRASPNDISRVIAAAKAVQDGIEKAAGRADRRLAALAKDRDALTTLRERVHADTWADEEKAITKQLKTLAKRATKRFESAAVDAKAYASYTGGEEEHRQFMVDAKQTFEDIRDWEVALQKYDRGTTLISELRSEHSWHDTDRGRILRTGQGDVAWGGTTKKGKVSAYFQSALMDGKKWADQRYNSEQEAQTAAKNALINKLVKEGRVPAKLSERAPRPTTLADL